MLAAAPGPRIRLVGTAGTPVTWTAENEPKAIERLHRKLEMDVMEKRRIHTVLRFSLMLPVGFALGFWIIWG